jgi:hypothetical protein
MSDLVLKIDNSLKPHAFQAESKSPDISKYTIMSLIKIINKKIYNKLKRRLKKILFS